MKADNDNTSPRMRGFWGLSKIYRRPVEGTPVGPFTPIVTICLQRPRPGERRSLTLRALNEIAKSIKAKNVAAARARLRLVPRDE